MSDFYYEECGRQGDIVRVVLSGKIDSFHCDYLFQCVERQIADGCKKLILDCKDLEYISSLGMAMLVRAHARMKKHGGDVKITGLRGVAAAAVRLVNLDRIFEIYPTLEETVAAHGG